MIYINLYDKCNMNLKTPEQGEHCNPKKVRGASIGYCWGGMPNSIPKTIDYVRDGTGIFDLYRNECLRKAKYLGKTDTKILWLREARAINPNTYNEIARNFKYFFDVVGYKYIYTWDEQLLNLDDRFKWTFGSGTNIVESGRQLFEKTKNVSMLASNKRLTPLHHKRLEVARRIKHEIPVFGLAGLGYIDDKLTALKDYRFSINFENEMSISEKLIDCFITGTVPVYIGPKLPSRLNFKEEGIVRWDDNLDLKTLDESRYNEMYSAVEHNYYEALKYSNSADYTFGENGFYWNDR